MPYVLPSNASSEEYRKELEEIEKKGECPFCSKNISNAIFTTHHWAVFTNEYPYKEASQHFLIIYREHSEDVTDLLADALAELTHLVLKLQLAYKLEGHKLLIRSGDMKKSGATVQHLHAQLIEMK